MTRAEAKKRIEKAVKKLNEMDNKLVFSYEETDFSVELICKSKIEESVQFGVYEYIGLFDEFVNKTDAYITCMWFAEMIIAASKINDEKAYHNLAF